MEIVSTAQRIRDSRPATLTALAIVLLAQVPVVAVFSGIPALRDSLVGASAFWMFGAGVWTVYTVVLLLAPLADVRNHPKRDSWGPFETLNVYTYVSARQIGIRLLHGLLGFMIMLFGVMLFVAKPLLLVFPAAVMVLAVVLMGAHVGTKNPSKEIRRHL